MRTVIGTKATGSRSPARTSLATTHQSMYPESVRSLSGDDHLVALILHSDPERARALADRALEPLERLPAATAERLTRTLEAWLEHACNGTATSEALHVHPQTFRYRLRQLQEVLGEDALADPDRRLELQLALRARRQRARPL